LVSRPRAGFDSLLAGGELLVAVHHRKLMVISTTEERIDMWLEEFGKALRDDLAIVASGNPATS